MPEELRVSFGYQQEGHFTMDEVDAKFYNELPGVTYEFRDKDGRLAIPAPDADQWIQVVGQAIMALPALATIIKAWLDSRRRVIVIEVGNDKLSYKGPGLKEDAPEIQAMIEKLIKKASSHDARIEALILPD